MRRSVAIRVRDKTIGEMILMVVLGPRGVDLGEECSTRIDMFARRQGNTGAIVVLSDDLVAGKNIHSVGGRVSTVWKILFDP